MKAMKQIKQILLGSLLMGSLNLHAESASGPAYNRIPELCTGARIITDDGYGGTIKGIFSDRHLIAVQLDGYQGLDNINVRNVTLTNLCTRDFKFCAGDEVIDYSYGEYATIVSLSVELGRYYEEAPFAMVYYKGQPLPYEKVYLRDLAVTNACEKIGGCKYARNRLSKKR